MTFARISSPIHLSSVVALALCASAGLAQTISFDNSAGTLLWHGSYQNFVPPVDCYCYNNWDTGIFDSTDCHTCPREPSALDDVYIGNFHVILNSSDPIHTLTTTVLFTNQYIVNSSGASLYGGEVRCENGAFQNGQHFFTQLVTVPTGYNADFREGFHYFTNGLLISADAQVIFGGDSSNSSIATWNGDQTVYVDQAYAPNIPGGILRNLQNASFLATGNGEMRGVISTGHFLNSGHFVKDGGTGTTKISIEFKNLPTGVIEARSGVLQLAAAATLEGTAQIVAGAVLELDTGNQVIPTAFATSGTGLFRVAASELNVAAGATATIPRLDIVSNSNLRGAGTTNVSVSANLSGRWLDAGTMNLASTCQSTLDAAGLEIEGAYTLNNRGVLTWTTSNPAIAAGSSINNLPGGIFTCAGDNLIGGWASSGEGTLTNAGTLRKTAGVRTQITVPFINSGRVECSAGALSFVHFHQTGGECILMGGSLDADYQVDPLLFDGGTLRGSGNIKGPVVNNGGTIAPGNSPGTITLSGSTYGHSYTQGHGGTLAIEIGGTAPAAFDRLLVSAPATLDGTLRVTLINGFSPFDGDTFDVLTCTSRSGQFSTEDLPQGFTAQYLPTGVRLHFAGCVADVDDGSGTGHPDGGVTIDDLLYYLVLFAAGDIRGDVDDGSATGTPDGGVTIDDLLYYLTRFAAGC